MQILYNDQGAAAAVGAVAAYQEQANAIAHTRAGVHLDLAALEPRIREACADLAAALLPASDAGTVARAIGQTGCVRLRDLHEQLERELGEMVREREQIGQDPAFRDREVLLAPRVGTYVERVAEARAQVDALSPAVARYEASRDFVQTLAAARRGPPGAVGGLLRRALLFGFVADWLAARRRVRVEQAFGCGVAESLARYGEARAAYDTWRAALAQAEAAKTGLEQRITRHEWLSGQVAVHERQSLEPLRAHLAAFLERSEHLSHVRKGVPQQARPLVTTLIVLRQKQLYLSRLVQYLSAEMTDRQQRAAKIAAVAQKWRGKPRKRLRGDKTGWLVTGPRQKHASTDRALERIRTMHRVIWDFDDYLLYDRLLDVTDTMLPYDVFARCSDLRPPADAFACEVLEDVGEYRMEHGSADYSHIDDASSASTLAGGAVFAAAAVALTTDMDDVGDWMDDTGSDADDFDAGGEEPEEDPESGQEEMEELS